MSKWSNDMAPETAFRIVLSRVEDLARDRSDQLHEARASNAEQRRAIQDMERKIRAYRESLEAHRKALKAAKVPPKKLPHVPDFHIEAVKADEDIPF